MPKIFQEEYLALWATTWSLIYIFLFTPNISYTMDFVWNRKLKEAPINMPWPIRFEHSMTTHVRLLNSHTESTLRTSGDCHFLWKEGTKEESMSERSVAMSWTAKRKLRAAAAHMRELKTVKLSLPTSEHGSEPTSSSSNIIESSGYFSDAFIERSNLSDCSPWSRRRREQRS